MTHPLAMELAGLESLRLNPDDERDAAIIDYIRALETEVINLTREMSGQLADMRREQSAIELAGRRLDDALSRLVAQAQPAGPPARPAVKKRVILHRTRIVPRLKIIKAASR